MTAEKKIAAIDVGKANVDSIVSGTNKVKRSKNGAKQLAGLMTTFLAEGVTLVLMEASGGYERGIVMAAIEAGLGIHVANPTRVRN